MHDKIFHTRVLTVSKRECVQVYRPSGSPSRGLVVPPVEADRFPQLMDKEEEHMFCFEWQQRHEWRQLQLYAMFS
jgi:hypothetical protein